MENITQLDPNEAEESSFEQQVKFVTPNNDDFHAAAIYKPLATEPPEIRILVLHPGPKHAQIECQLLSNMALDKSHHQAVSYCAGSPMDTEQILVNGTPFDVFASLGKALRQIRSLDSPEILWVDQVCINQRDFSEREQQVKLMERVYSEATRTYVWLGEDPVSNSEETAIAFAHDIAAKAVHGIAAMLLAQVDAEKLFPDWLLAEAMAGEYADQIRAIVKMSSMPLWKRCWVFQEVVLSEEPVFLYGSCRVPFTSLSAAIYFTSIVQTKLLDLSDWVTLTPDVEPAWSSRCDDWAYALIATNDVLRVVGLKIRWVKGEYLPVRRVFEVYRCSESTDPRDRVHGLLGLIDPGYNIKPDYRPHSTPNTVYTAAALRIIEIDMNLDIISNSQGWTSKFPKPSMPSWVPDFSRHLGRTSILSVEPVELRQFDASLVNTRPEALYADLLPIEHRMLDQDPDYCVLRCNLLDLGVMANTATYSNTTPRGTRRFEVWRACVTAAGIEDVYNATRQPVETAVLQTIARGAHPDGDTTGDVTHPTTASNQQIYRLYYDEAINLGEQLWRFFVTPGGIMGMAPRAAEIDDRVCILLGARAPFICRRLPKPEPAYAIIGECYLHGFMKGEACHNFLSGKMKGELLRVDLY